MTCGVDESTGFVQWLVANAGGRLVGRTRIQKTTYIIQYLGFSKCEFDFAYRHYGPYSESFASDKVEAHQ